MLQYIHSVQNKVRSEAEMLAVSFVCQTTWKKSPLSKKKGMLEVLMAF